MPSGTSVLLTASLLHAMVGREAAIKARRHSQPAFNNSMRDSANAAAAFCSDSINVQEPRSVSGVAEDRGAGAQTRIDCRGSNVPQIILFEIHKVICLAFFVRHGVSKEIYFYSADGPSEQIGIIAAPPLLGLVHDLTDGYAALWACVVVILGAVYAVTRIAGE
jgi:hypothetical protein